MDGGLIMLNEQIKFQEISIPSIFIGSKPTIDNSEVSFSTFEQFSTLYESNFARIFHFILYRMGDGQGAEDLTAQVFLKAWEKRDHYKQAGVPFMAWLFTIARNAVIDNHRGSRETVSLEDDSTLESDTPTPAEVCESRMETDQIKEALATLTSEQYHVVIWKFFDGLTTTEIANRLGKQEGSVRALQMRGLRKLAEKLKEKE